MARSDYRYGIELYAGRNVIAIEDLNLGRTSVTNDIENVIGEIQSKDHIDPNNYIILYRDSEKIWDGYNYRSASFVPLRSGTWKEAVIKYIKTQF